MVSELPPLQQEKKRLAERRKEQLREILRRRRRSPGRGGGPLPPRVTVEQAERSLAQRQASEAAEAAKKAAPPQIQPAPSVRPPAISRFQRLPAEAPRRPRRFERILGRPRTLTEAALGRRERPLERRPPVAAKAKAPRPSRAVVGLGEPRTLTAAVLERKEVSPRDRTTFQKIKFIAKDIAFGEAGKGLVGVGPLTPFPVITFQETKEIARRRGLPGKVVGELIPTTPGEIAIIGGAVAALPFAPAVARLGAEAIFTGIGIKTAIDPTLAPEQRIAGGILAGVAGTAGLIEVAPFARGAVARISPGFKPVKRVEPGLRVIQKEQIGIIPLKAPKPTPAQLKVGLGKSPLVKGAFGLKRSEFAKFVGKKQVTVTGFQTPFKGAGKPLARPFFTTPQDPLTGLGALRESRLGLRSLFEFPRQVRLGIAGGRPEAIIFRGAQVAAKPTRGAFLIGPIGKLGELQAVAGIGQVVTKGPQIGVTVIKGQAVPFFAGALRGVGRVGPAAAISTQVSTTIPVTTAITPAIARPFIFRPTRPTPEISKTLLPRVTVPSVIIRDPISPPPTPPRRTTRPSRISRRPSIPSPLPQIPSLPPSPPSVIITPPSPLLAPTTPPSLPSRPPSLPPTPLEFPKIFRITGLPKPRKAPGRFPVFLRRFGVFRPIGIGRTPGQAIAIGRRAAQTTLGATFKIPGIGRRRVRGFRTKLTREGALFIELPKFRLSTGTEVREIQAFRRVKRKKKKMKGGRKKR